MTTQVHAAIELLDLAALAKLLNEEARFHFGRKLTDSEVNMLVKMKMVLVSRQIKRLLIIIIMRRMIMLIMILLPLLMWRI